MTLHGQEINIGDEVVDLKYGKGEVYEIHPKYAFPLLVQFKTFKLAFTEEGRQTDEALPTLHWPGVTVIPGKKKVKIKVWDWVVYPLPANPNTNPIIATNLSETGVVDFIDRTHSLYARKIEGTEREVDV